MKYSAYSLVVLAILTACTSGRETEFSLAVPTSSAALYSVNAGLVGDDVTLPEVVEHPTFMNHARPTPDSTQDEDNTYVLDYRACEDIRSPNYLMAQLDANFSIAAICMNDSEVYSPQPPDYIYRINCMFPRDVSYVIVDGESWHLVQNAEKLRTLIAPIESEAEAMSYALATTGLEAAFGLKFDSEARYFVETIEDSYVVEQEDGYLVHLYHSAICGCTPWLTSTVDIMIYPDGIVEWLQAYPAFDIGSDNPGECGD